MPNKQAGLRKGRGTWDHRASIRWIMETTGDYRKKVYLHFITTAKICTDHASIWKILILMGIPEYLTILLRKL